MIDTTTPQSYKFKLLFLFASSRLGAPTENCGERFILTAFFLAELNYENGGRLML